MLRLVVDNRRKPVLQLVRTPLPIQVWRARGRLDWERIIVAVALMVASWIVVGAAVLALTHAWGTP